MVTVSLVDVHLRLLPCRPAGRWAALAACMGGVVSATLPTGVEGLPHGLGVVGGLAQGIRASLVCLPLVVAGLTITTVAESPQPSGSQAQELAGQPRCLRLRAETMAAWAYSVCLCVLTVIAAVVVGACDAVSQRSGFVSSAPHSVHLIDAVAFPVVGVEALALVLLVRWRNRALAALAGLVLLFASAIVITSQIDAMWAARAASFTPLGPVWSRAIGAGYPWSIPMSLHLQTAVTTGWLLVSVIVVAWRSRQVRRAKK